MSTGKQRYPYLRLGGRGSRHVRFEAERNSATIAGMSSIGGEQSVLVPGGTVKLSRVRAGNGRMASLFFGGASGHRGTIIFRNDDVYTHSRLDELFLFLLSEI